MPVVIPETIPALKTLTKENIFVMTDGRAKSQDIRPLKIAILNLMPDKIVTETQFLRLLSNTPLQVDVTFLRTERTSTHTAQEHMEQFYQTFSAVQDHYFDGLIITGAPVETIPFEEVSYWEELREIMDWAQTHVYSTLYICWAAQAGLYHFYGVPKFELPQKVFGVFEHRAEKDNTDILRGLDDIFFAPHSRHTEVRREDIEQVPELDILATSEEAGIFIVADKKARQVFVTGHVEYDRETLGKEYFRDRDKGLDNVPLPANYFIDDDPEKGIHSFWKSTGYILFANWLNYFTYQATPYNISDIPSK